MPMADPSPIAWTDLPLGTYHKLFIHNLARDTVDSDLRIIFQPYRPEYVNVARGKKGTSRRFGFALFKDVHDAHGALAALQGRVVRGFPLALKPAVAGEPFPEGFEDREDLAPRPRAPPVASSLPHVPGAVHRPRLKWEVSLDHGNRTSVLDRLGPSPPLAPPAHPYRVEHSPKMREATVFHAAHHQAAPPPGYGLALAGGAPPPGLQRKHTLEPGRAVVLPSPPRQDRAVAGVGGQQPSGPEMRSFPEPWASLPSAGRVARLPTAVMRRDQPHLQAMLQPLASSLPGRTRVMSTQPPPHGRPSGPPHPSVPASPGEAPEWRRRPEATQTSQPPPPAAAPRPGTSAAPCGAWMRVRSGVGEWGGPKAGEGWQGPRSSGVPGELKDLQPTRSGAGVDEGGDGRGGREVDGETEWVQSDNLARALEKVNWWAEPGEPRGQRSLGAGGDRQGAPTPVDPARRGHGLTGCGTEPAIPPVGGDAAPPIAVGDGDARAAEAAAASEFGPSATPLTLPLFDDVEAGTPDVELRALAASTTLPREAARKVFLEREALKQLADLEALILATGAADLAEAPPSALLGTLVRVLHGGCYSLRRVLRTRLGEDGRLRLELEGIDVAILPDHVSGTDPFVPGGSASKELQELRASLVGGNVPATVELVLLASRLEASRAWLSRHGDKPAFAQVRELRRLRADWDDCLAGLERGLRSLRDQMAQGEASGAALEEFEFHGSSATGPRPAADKRGLRHAVTPAPRLPMPGISSLPTEASRVVAGAAKVESHSGATGSSALVSDGTTASASSSFWERCVANAAEGGGAPSEGGDAEGTSVGLGDAGCHRDRVAEATKGSFDPAEGQGNGADAPPSDGAAGRGDLAPATGCAGDLGEPASSTTGAPITPAEGSLAALLPRRLFEASPVEWGGFAAPRLSWPTSYDAGGEREQGGGNVA